MPVKRKPLRITLFRSIVFLDLVKSECYIETEVMRVLSERLSELIAVLGLKKGEFADRIGFSQAYISLITAGKRPNPSDRFFASVSRAFQVNEGWLRTGEGEMFGGFEDDLSQTDLALVQKYRALPIHERQIVDEIVDAFALRRVSQDPEQEDEPSS